MGIKPPQPTSALGRPVLSGPSIENFADVAEPLERAGVLTLVDSPGDLADALMGYFANPKGAQQAGRAGHAVIETQKGALDRTLTGLASLLTP